jgi:hypothetical protein
MSLTAQIGSSDVAFKLSQKIVSTLAEKFSFKFEDGWNAVSSRPVDNIQKRLKREKRKNNPAGHVRKPRTAFSFFTQKQRPVSQAAHPTSSFGELSRFVSEAWRALTPVQMAEFKAMEVADKTRYQQEKAAALAAAASGEVAQPAAATPAAATESKPKKATSAKASKAAAAPVAAAPVAASPVAAAPVAAAPKKEKAVKAPKAAPADAPATDPAPVAAPVAEKKSAGKVKAAAPAAPAAAPAAKPAKAAAPKKATK